jgi:hypothetical protein
MKIKLLTLLLLSIFASLASCAMLNNISQSKISLRYNIPVQDFSKFAKFQVLKFKKIENGCKINLATLDKQLIFLNVTGDCQQIFKGKENA